MLILKLNAQEFRKLKSSDIIPIMGVDPIAETQEITLRLSEQELEKVKQANLFPIETVSNFVNKIPKANLFPIKDSIESNKPVSPILLPGEPAKNIKLKLSREEFEKLKAANLFPIDGEPSKDQKEIVLSISEEEFNKLKQANLFPIKTGVKADAKTKVAGGSATKAKAPEKIEVKEEIREKDKRKLKNLKRKSLKLEKKARGEENKEKVNEEEAEKKKLKPEPIEKAKIQEEDLLLKSITSVKKQNLESFPESSDKSKNISKRVGVEPKQNFKVQSKKLRPKLQIKSKPAIKIKKPNKKVTSLKIKQLILSPIQKVEKIYPAKIHRNKGSGREVKTSHSSAEEIERNKAQTSSVFPRQKSERKQEKIISVSNREGMLKRLKEVYA